MESMVLQINAPEAHVTGNLRSVHCNSAVRCKTFNVTVSERTGGAAIYDSQKEKFIVEDSVAGVLSVHASDIQVTRLSEGEIFRRQMQIKMQSRKQK